MSKIEISARIEENQSMLKMAELHMDERACLVLRQRIFNLQKLFDEPTPSAESMEDVLKKHEWLPGGGWTKENMLSAMSEWASIKCAENDREIESMEMELDALAKIKDYWYNRCYQSEKFIEESPCDPDITKEQIEAHKNWQESKKLTN